MSDLQIVRLVVAEIDRYAGPFIELLEELPEDKLWATSGKLPNSIGVLVRHVTGNLNFYFGEGILKNGYSRDRDKEFSQTGLPKAQVVADLKAAINVVKQSIEAVDPAQLEQPYTSPDGRAYDSLSSHIIHMTAHFVLHYGHADYARHVLA